MKPFEDLTADEIAALAEVTASDRREAERFTQELARKAGPKARARRRLQAMLEATEDVRV